MRPTLGSDDRAGGVSVRGGADGNRDRARLGKRGLCRGQAFGRWSNFIPGSTLSALRRESTSLRRGAVPPSSVMVQPVRRVMPREDLLIEPGAERAR